MKIGDRVDTPDGIGTIKQQDSVHERAFPSAKLQTTWLDRWGVLHDTYPENRPTGMYTNDLLYYPPTSLRIL